MGWEHYGASMRVNQTVEVDCVEFSELRGNTFVVCLMLTKVGKKRFALSLARPKILAHLEDVEHEEDEYGHFMMPEELGGDPVFKQLGDYYCGYDMVPYPDDANSVEFTSFADQRIDEWLETNGWPDKLLEIIPEAQTTLDY